uniref:Uncharacterized protein n=1 Tax=viral metagenome TaxID=1070528 RepID=A0A6M3J499_9ZZZZ
MEYSVLEDPNAVYEFDENGNPRNPYDSQSLIQPAIPAEAPVPLITNRPERMQEAIDTRGGFIDEGGRPISYKSGPEGRDLSEPAISKASPIITNEEELRQSALDTGGAFIENDQKVTSYRKEPPKLSVEQQLNKIEQLTPEQLTKVFEGKYNVSLTKSAEEQALGQVRSETPGAFRKRFGYDISRASNADLTAFIKDRDKVAKGITKIFEERQKLAIEARKEFSADNIRQLKEENRQLDQMLKATKPPTPKNVPFMDAKGRVIMINKNDPNSQAVIDKNGLVPYSKPTAPKKPEYKPGQAMKRMSAISSAISKLKSGSTIDALLMSQIPEYAGLMASSDPAAKEQAISQMKAELEYVKQFAPKGSGAEAEVPKAGKVLDKVTAAAILKEAGGDKTKARDLAKKKGYTF